MAENTEDNSSHGKPLFRDITAEDDDPEITEIQSLCVRCNQQGVTRLLLTRIPFFKEVIVSSFHCDHCGNYNAGLDPGGAVQEQGVTYTLTLRNKEDLNRQMVQTKYASIKIPSLDFEIPPNNGALTTIEGLIEQAIEGLQQDQALRRIQHPELAAQIDSFCERLEKLKSLEEPFELVLDDPSGNSFLENPHAPDRDPDLVMFHYKRSKLQDAQLGLTDPDAELGAQELDVESASVAPQKDEVLQFQVNCSRCRSPCVTNMKLVDIPHFKQTVIMSTNCDICGHRDNEVKSGGAIEPKGQRIKLNITSPVDLSRDILKSETCSITIPEFHFETGMGTLGGKFTTVEGLLVDIKNQLKESNPFYVGDSSDADKAKKLSEFCDKLDEIISGKRLNVCIVLDDPAGNSYLQNIHSPAEDPELTIEDYERTFEQNEELGLNDMKTENYKS